MLMTDVADDATLSAGLARDTALYERDDAARLEVLRSYDILDTQPEAAFDRIVELAQAVFDTPIALVSFIDGSRQWFKARIGLEVSETPREQAFCDHVIRQSEVMVVPDARKDARFYDNPLVTGGPRIRFYAGAPMVTPEGARLGSVCIISPEPRAAMSERDRARLQALAGIAANELELRRKTAHAELLAAELEHRVRTTLHFVSRILEAQAAQMADRVSRQHLLSAVDRLAGIEIVQRHLSQAGAVFETDARDYLLSLLLSLEETLLDGAEARIISVDETGDLAMSADGLARLGMIVVELVTNALRHGRGNVTVHAERDGPMVAVTVGDEGTGFPAGRIDIALQGRTGLRLVSMLAVPGGITIDPARPQRITVRLADG
jgi:two-component sensor histidine kinase